MPLKVVKKPEEVNLKYNEAGLIPAIVQDFKTGEVLMLAYMNKESLTKTLETGNTWFYSRSRGELWNKGATSGNFQEIKSVYYDCDADTFLVKVEQKGVACHLGTRSCFTEMLAIRQEEADESRELLNFPIILEEIIEQRRRQESKESYVSSLFKKGLDSMLKKIGEEGAEVVIAAKNDDREELIYEAGDLLFHLLLVLKAQGVSYREVLAELKRRHLKKKAPKEDI